MSNNNSVAQPFCLSDVIRKEPIMKVVRRARKTKQVNFYTTTHKQVVTTPLISTMDKVIAKGVPANNKFAEVYYVGLERLNAALFENRRYKYGELNNLAVARDDLLSAFIRIGCVSNMEEAKSILPQITHDYIGMRDPHGNLVFKIKEHPNKILHKGEYQVISKM